MHFSSIALSLASLIALATAAQLPEDIYLSNYVYGGTGCPQGTVSGDVNKDRRTFTISTPPFTAKIGPSYPVAESRKNCQVLLNFVYPSGYTYRVKSLTRSGHFSVGAGITATYKDIVYFSGSAQESSWERKVEGPTEADWKVTYGADEKTVWAPCGQVQALNINAQVNLYKAKASATTGSIEMDPVYYSDNDRVLELEWKKC